MWLEILLYSAFFLFSAVTMFSATNFGWPILWIRLLQAVSLFNAVMFVTRIREAMMWQGNRND